MDTMKISLDIARRLVLHAQLLDGQTTFSEGKEGIAQTTEKLGYVQIDPLIVVERAHNHILWTRRSDYKEHMVHELQNDDRRIFEYWGHAQSFMPMSDYRYTLPRKRNFINPKSKWAQYHLEKFGHMLESVLYRIREQGPLSSKDVNSQKSPNSKTEENAKTIKGALDYLFWRGDLMITERRNFQKVYDLTERVVPSGIDTSFPPDDELGRFFVLRALSAFGVAREKEIRIFMQPETSRDSHFQAAGKEVISKSLSDIVDAGEAICLKIEDDSADYYALSKTLEKTAELSQSSSHLFLLSPFDNLIIQRERTKRLFGFDYALECYVPAAKRKYGYFVLPILWGEKFVGRLDPKNDRKKKTLIINNIFFEPEFNNFDEFLPLFAEKLVEFARFNQCDKLLIEGITPKSIKSILEDFLIKSNLGIELLN